VSSLAPRAALEAWWVPPGELPLYGTTWWDSSSEVQRRDYARQEAANGAAWIIQIELYLLLVLLRQFSAADARDRRQIARESAEEWEHIRLFSEVIRVTGAAPTIPNRLGRAVLFFLRRRSLGTLYPMVVTYLAESYVYAFHEACVNGDVPCDGRVTEVLDIHMRDERGHLAFAQRKIVALWPVAGAFERCAIRVGAPLIAAVIGHAVFTIPAGQGRFECHRLAWKAPTHRARVEARFERAVAFLGETGVVTRRSRGLWRRLRVAA